jgi:hypothetical protein
MKVFVVLSAVASLAFSLPYGHGGGGIGIQPAGFGRISNLRNLFECLWNNFVQNINKNRWLRIGCIGRR